MMYETLKRNGYDPDKLTVDQYYHYAICLNRLYALRDPSSFRVVRAKKK